MTSLVYSRKWRPQRFADLAGQEHVVTTLRHAVAQGRVGHSYLFCGPRGTGKTTTARLLAKAANCQELEDGDPCNTCPTCLAVTEGRLLDVIELDAASNRGIDEIRNIRDKVNFSPGEGQRKVYIIDEAHMLTEQASNAFLKTLEEPPAHALFVLCTTEPHKLLPTIVSRCQRFDFRRIPSAVIVSRLEMVCQEEGVAADQEALQALARHAAGSLRDAENLLEQLVVSYGSPVGLQGVLELLGTGDASRAMELVQYLLAGNSASALGALNRAAWDGVDLRQLHRQAVELIRAVLVHQWGAGESLDLPAEVTSEVATLASRAETERVAKALRLFAQVDMRRDAPSPLPLELAVVETCMDTPIAAAPTPAGRPPAARPANAASPRPPAARQAADRPAPVTPAPRAARAPVEEASVVRQGMSASPPESSAPVHEPVEGWAELVKALSRAKGRRFNIGALLRDCKGQSVEGDQLTLTFAHRSHLERLQEELDDPQSQRTVREAVEQRLGTPYTLNLVLSEDGNGRAVSAAAVESPLVRYAMGMGARIVEEKQP